MNSSQIKSSLRAVLAGAASFLAPAALNACRTSPPTTAASLVSMLLLFVGFTLIAMAVGIGSPRDKSLALAFKYVRWGFGLISLGLIVIIIF